MKNMQEGIGTQRERLEAVATVLAIVAAKARSLADLKPEDRESHGAALAVQIDSIADEVKRIAENHYVRAGVISKLTAT